ncbi:MAG: hypothetical protein IKI62_04300 [Clostridia bacterium]|nr:hypothetical protein [Clostridia bacterium]
MKDRIQKVLNIITIVTFVLSLVAFGFSLLGKNGAKKDVQYVLYVGTNDKDTNRPVFSHEESMEKAKEILIDHFGGYTIQEANGGWKDGDTVYQEYTLVIYLSDTTPEEVHKACDDLIKTFNQSSILIQANETTTEFYSNEGN